MSIEPENSDRSTDDAEIARLAKLSAIEYERHREDAAKKLGVRVTVLDKSVDDVRRRQSARDTGSSPDFLSDVQPWHDPVDGACLLAAISDSLERFTVLPEGGAVAIALWVIHTHAHDAAAHSPNLALESPEKRCGKTTTLSLIANLVPRSLSAANISPAALFRSVEKFRPTLLIDEGDSFLRDNEDMRGILNSGFTKASAFVIRCVGDNHDPRQFPVWCPKLIALIGTLPDTLQDRSIVITLRRKLEHENVERFTFCHRPQLQELRAKANVGHKTTSTPSRHPIRRCRRG